MIRRILLVHGIWNAKSWLLPLAARLRAEGFAPQVFGYASVFGGPEQAVPRTDHRPALHLPVRMPRQHDDDLRPVRFGESHG